MRNIHLSNDVADSVRNVKDFFKKDNIAQEGLGPSHIENEIAYHLSRGVSNEVAIEMFYQASVAFEVTEVFQGKSRLYFRDYITTLLQQWLNQDFDAGEKLKSGTIGKFFGAFSNFEYRMPERLHNLMKEKTREQADRLSAKDALHILAYHARAADFMTSELFDIIAEPVLHRVGIIDRASTQHALEHLAVIDVMQAQGVTFGTHTAKDLYDSLLPLTGLSEIDPHYNRILKAQKWFDGKALVYSDHRHIHHSRVDDIRDALGQQEGIKVSDTFQRAAQGEETPTNVRTGADFVVSFNDNAQVGVVYDTRSGYLSVMGQSRVLRPNGKTLLNSALIARDNPADVVVRLSSMVAKNLSQAELKECLHAATHLKAGVYGVNNQREVVPLLHLGIAA